MAGFSLRQLKRALSYHRQFAGVPGVVYHRQHCQELARLIRQSAH